MKVGDLVKDNHPSWLGRGERIGVILGPGVDWKRSHFNKSFNVLWRDGTIGKNVWDYDLKMIKSS